MCLLNNYEIIWWMVCVCVCTCTNICKYFEIKNQPQMPIFKKPCLLGPETHKLGKTYCQKSPYLCLPNARMISICHRHFMRVLGIVFRH